MKKLVVKSKVKAAGLGQHNARRIRIESNVKVGSIPTNHNTRSIRIKSNVRSGGSPSNHNGRRISR